MLGKLVRLVIGSRNDRLIKKKRSLVKKINALASDYEKLSDDALKAKTQEFRDRLAQGEKLDNLLPEAFATVREASTRVFGMRHFDVQLIGGMILHDGKIAEMKTGEGKTLMATLAAYLNALPGRGVHVVTVNDYLAKRDSEWMGRLYGFLGLTTGVIISQMDSDARREAYASDITYGTNNEFGFDYLRDNMAFSLEQKVQRDLSFAIVDEVDSILIDEARTPLIISGPTEESTEIYIKVNKIIPFLTKQEKEGEPGDYSVDEKVRQLYLTEEGHERVENLMVEHGLMAEGSSLYDATNIRLMHYLTASLRGHVLFKKDVDYIVANNEVIIVDEFTGRIMPGRRWSEGLHQAIEAKEHATIQNENQTLASITFQNYFRLYEKLSGMTGTADTEAFELNKIYGLEVVVIPTHRNMIRKDLGDVVFLTTDEKYVAVADDIKECVSRGQPVLVGTTSIENSERLSALLNKQGIKHEVLNAKQHEREAHIIEQAGMPGAVTIATNMAGRGTDIVLGGNLEAELAALGEDAGEADRERVRGAWLDRHEQVIATGGLHVIGSERHESRRIDNQLRGRSGRQGDPGSTRFYLSLQDDLMRIFASDRVASLMQKLGMGNGEAIEHPWVTRSIESAQRKVEGRNFDVRKEILAYDDVANDQRKVVYAQRNELMAAEEISDIITAIREDVVNNVITQYIPPKTMVEQWDTKGLEEHLHQEFNVEIPVRKMLAEDHSLQEESLRKRIIEILEQNHKDKEQQMSKEVLRHFEKSVMLQVLDNSWKEHLAAMDYLRQGIHFRGYAQKDPKQEYKREAFEMFTNLLEHIKYEVIGILFKVQVRQEEDVHAIDEQMQAPREMHFEHAQAPALDAYEESLLAPAEQEEGATAEQPFIRDGNKVGRNDPCPCGSGKKFKQCHGQLS
ncbi:MAG: preprotein translocase subunit SecA [Methylobacter tundripaludum]|jgi:preprotein translocase subunit SecA|uniref:Protein translocase subunit SecA n=1 Tax=Methylobacter tundripaludum TaxID=173365 RepID=A0A2S6HHL9_9GAMM|nr:preprotein translocase subunit SecA [Methylobacter tundripaludum]MDD4905776.1 preprotein translocase subunit SecA [Methylobacter tundripaludum]PPK76968.1 protein translocase subunit secA [Methylobacter tundripaludum]